MSKCKSYTKRKKENDYKNFIAVGIFLTAILGIILLFTLSGKTNLESNDKGNVLLDTSSISSKGKYYNYNYEGTKMEFFVVRDTKGIVRMAFNRCQVCFDSGKGYFIQEGDEFVCQNCGNRYKTSSIGTERGGCNPSPITNDEKIVSGENVEILKKAFAENKYMFVK